VPLIGRNPPFARLGGGVDGAAGTLTLPPIPMSWDGVHLRIQLPATPMIHASTSRAIPARTRATGFTLIEVMITVAIIGILAAIALPSYKGYIRRGQQPEAFNALSDYRTKMEQYYQDNRNYGSAANKCADATTASSWNTFTPNGAKYFTFTCAADTASGDTTQQSYTITATATAGQVKDDTYTIDQNGNRATTKFKGASVTAACWLTTSTSC
jgi:type IV pilus assembly protein PilE